MQMWCGLFWEMQKEIQMRVRQRHALGVARPLVVVPSVIVAVVVIVIVFFVAFV